MASHQKGEDRITTDEKKHTDNDTNSQKHVSKNGKKTNYLKDGNDENVVIINESKQTQSRQRKFRYGNDERSIKYTSRIQIKSVQDFKEAYTQNNIEIPDYVNIELEDNTTEDVMKPTFHFVIKLNNKQRLPTRCPKCHIYMFENIDGVNNHKCVFPPCADTKEGWKLCFGAHKVKHPEYFTQFKKNISSPSLNGSSTKIYEGGTPKLKKGFGTYNGKSDKINKDNIKKRKRDTQETKESKMRKIALDSGIPSDDYNYIKEIFGYIDNKSNVDNEDDAKELDVDQEADDTGDTKITIKEEKKDQEQDDNENVTRTEISPNSISTKFQSNGSEKNSYRNPPYKKYQRKNRNRSSRTTGLNDIVKRDKVRNNDVNTMGDPSITTGFNECLEWTNIKEEFRTDVLNGMKTSELNGLLLKTFKTQVFLENLRRDIGKVLEMKYKEVNLQNMTSVKYTRQFELNILEKILETKGITHEVIVTSAPL